MDRKEIDRLKLKKQALKQKLDTTAAILTLEQWWLPWYDTILENNVNHEWVYLNCVDEADHPIWMAALQQTPLAKYKLPSSVIKTPNSLFIHEHLLRFPNTHPLRYLPNLSHQDACIEPGIVLQQAAATLPIQAHQPVYFFFTRFTPVLTIPFAEIQNHVNLFYELPEDICLLPYSLDWMIFRSLEEEWRWGKMVDA